MNVKLLRIEPQPAAAGADMDVRVLVEIDGAEEWHFLRVEPNVLPGVDASLVVASDALQNRLRPVQPALHRICRLVGCEQRGQRVHLPEWIAA